MATEYRDTLHPMVEIEVTSKGGLVNKFVIREDTDYTWRATHNGLMFCLAKKTFKSCMDTVTKYIATEGYVG